MKMKNRLKSWLRKWALADLKGVLPPPSPPVSKFFQFYAVLGQIRQIVLGPPSEY